MRRHELKIWPEPFRAILDGRKRFEVRKDDRGYGVGDLLELREWDPAGYRRLSSVEGSYTGRKVTVRVTYILHGGRLGVAADYCVMSIEPEPDNA